MSILEASKKSVHDESRSVVNTLAIRMENMIGLDIGTEKIKIVKCSGGKVIRAGWANVPDGVIRQSRIESAELLVDTIVKLKKDARIGNGNCALCISGAETVIRQISLPEMEQKQIYKNVVSEIAGYLPATPDRYNIDYRIPEVVLGSAAPVLNTMVVATPKENVAAYTQCLKKAGLTVKYIDIMENGYEKLIRYLTAKGSVQTRNYAIVDLGAAKTNVMIYRNGTFVVNRILSTGTGMLFAELQNRLSVERRAGEKLLMTRGSLQPWDQEDEVGHNILTHLRSISRDVLKVIDFYESRNVEEPIGMVYLAGGLSHLSGIDETMSADLGVPVTILSKLTEFMHHKVRTNVEPVDYSSAISVTIREVSKK